MCECLNLNFIRASGFYATNNIAVKSNRIFFFGFDGVLEIKKDKQKV